MCIHVASADNVQCFAVPLQDMHAQAVMYEAVQVADEPANLAAAAAAAPCLLSSSGSSFAAAAAGLGVAQQAAALGLPCLQLDTPASFSTGPYGAAAAESGLPGLAKTLTAEAGVSVLQQQQQQDEAACIALLTGLGKAPQPTFSELYSRCVDMSCEHTIRF
jgi:hypothetical protein